MFMTIAAGNWFGRGRRQFSSPLRAMGLIVEMGNLELSALAKDHLVAGQPFDVSDYRALPLRAPACWKWWSG
jgi:hypothetical protein